MSWKSVKEFLKFDWRKVIIFLVFIIPISIIPNFGFGIWWPGADIGTNYGFPFNFYGYGGGPPSPIVTQALNYYFDYWALTFDIVFWYFISYFAVWVYDRVRRER